MSVSTTPVSALLCDRLTLPARRGGSPAQEDLAVSLARTSWHRLQGNAGCPYGALYPVDSWPPPPFLLWVRPSGPPCFLGGQGSRQRVDGHPGSSLGGRVRGANYPELFALNYPPKGPGGTRQRPPLSSLASGFLFSEPGEGGAPCAGLVSHQVLTPCQASIPHAWFG